MPDPGNLWEEGAPAIGETLRQRRIWVATLPGDVPARQLTDASGYRDEWPVWSADGSHLLFARLDGQDRASLWLIPAEGGEPQRVVAELAPTSEWFDYSGHLDWSQLFARWRG